MSDGWVDRRALEVDTRATSASIRPLAQRFVEPRAPSGKEANVLERKRVVAVLEGLVSFFDMRVALWLDLMLV